MKENLILVMSSVMLTFAIQADAGPNSDLEKKFEDSQAQKQSAQLEAIKTQNPDLLSARTKQEFRQKARQSQMQEIGLAALDLFNKKQKSSFIWPDLKDFKEEVPGPESVAGKEINDLWVEKSMTTYFQVNLTVICQAQLIYYKTLVGHWYNFTANNQSTDAGRTARVDVLCTDSQNANYKWSGSGDYVTPERIIEGTSPSTLKAYLLNPKQVDMSPQDPYLNSRY